MEPLRGKAEHISAKTAAVINMNTMLMIYDDLEEMSTIAVDEHGDSERTR